MPDAYDRIRDSRVSQIGDTESDAYMRGREHAQSGKPVTANPYSKYNPKHSMLYHAYVNGHKAGSGVAEATMTSAQKTKRERIVKGMKASFKDLRSRYGSKAKSVMYATATKNAMKAEEAAAENLDVVVEAAALPAEPSVVKLTNHLVKNHKAKKQSSYAKAVTANPYSDKHCLVSYASKKESEKIVQKLSATDGWKKSGTNRFKHENGTEVHFAHRQDAPTTITVTGKKKAKSLPTNYD